MGLTLGPRVLNGEGAVGPVMVATAAVLGPEYCAMSWREALAGGALSTEKETVGPSEGGNHQRMKL